jgi:hypothetical protein
MKLSARHPKTLMVLDLDFDSMEEAKKHNPSLVEWTIKER